MNCIYKIKLNIFYSKVTFKLSIKILIKNNFTEPIDENVCFPLYPLI